MSTTQEFLDLIPASHDPGQVALACDLSMREVEEGKLETQVHSLLHSEFETSLSFMKRSCLKFSFEKPFSTISNLLTH